MDSRLTQQLDEQRRKVDFDTYDMSVRELIGMVVGSPALINISPTYQRQFRWEEDRQSSLVESVFLGIPIPSLFMAANADGTWEVIDGVQRLSTLVHFAGGLEGQHIISSQHPLRLEELQKLSRLNGLTFADLPQAVKNVFMLKPMKITTISDKSNRQVRFDLFERLNTGGVILTPQEIRTCVFRGAFSDYLRTQAHDSEFQSVVRLPRNQQRDGTPEECVLRFYAYLYEYESFDHSVKDFLNGYMERATREFDYAWNSEVFRAVFRALADALPQGITRENRKTTPLNLFEAVAVGAGLAYVQHGAINADNAAEWIHSKELHEFTTGATNSRPKVLGRIHYCRDRFAGGSC